MSGLIVLAPLFSWLNGWDPVSAADPFGPGPEVSEVRNDGTWQSDAIEHAASVSWSAGEPCVMECPGPRYVYRVAPGDPFTYLSSIRNDGPVRITLLGRTHFPGDDLEGLALIRDPSLGLADPANLLPFHPVDLVPGASVTVAVVRTASDCADPVADVPREMGGAGPATGQPFVYDVLGWRRQGYVWPHFTVTVAGCTEGS